VTSSVAGGLTRCCSMNSGAARHTWCRQCWHPPLTQARVQVKQRSRQLTNATLRTAMRPCRQHGACTCCGPARLQALGPCPCRLPTRDVHSAWACTACPDCVHPASARSRVQSALLSKTGLLLPLPLPLLLWVQYLLFGALLPVSLRFGSQPVLLAAPCLLLLCDQQLLPPQRLRLAVRDLRGSSPASAGGPLAAAAAAAAA
jgi:hypothetical protein